MDGYEIMKRVVVPGGKRGIMTHQRLRAVLMTVTAIGLLGALAPATTALAGPSVAAASPSAAPTDCPTPATFDPRVGDISPTNGTQSTSFSVSFRWTPVVLPADCDAVVQLLVYTTIPVTGAPAPSPVSVPAASGGYTTILASPARYGFQARLVVNGVAGPWLPSPAQQFTLLPLDYCMGWVHPPSGTPVSGQALDATTAQLSVNVGPQDQLHLQLCGAPAIFAAALDDSTAPTVRFPSGATTATVTGLTPGRTYRWQVYVGGTVYGTVTITQPPAPGGCLVDLRVVSSWSNQHSVSVTVTAGPAALTGWRVSWPAQGSIAQLWNGVLDSDPASQVTTIGNAPYNGALGAGQTTTFGFIANGGDWSSASLTGLTCTPAAGI